MAFLHRAASVSRTRLLSHTTPARSPLPLSGGVGSVLLQQQSRALCLPPFGSRQEASDDPLPVDHDAFECAKAKPIDVCAADGITPEAALAELRKLRNNPNLTAADLGIHTPTPIAPFTDVDPITGEVVGKAKKGFFTKKTVEA